MPIQTLALNLQTDNATPEWLMLIPAGLIAGRDGRQWINDQPEAVIAYNRQLNRDIVFDYEHATQLKAVKGEKAPASGWITPGELEVREGAVWGRVAWNEDGKTALNKEEYRYYSPAFLYDANSRITGIHHIALTNRHNLYDLPALNHQLPHEEKPMAIALALATVLGLNASTSSDEDAITAITQLKVQNQELALNSQKPDLTKHIPIETHQLALNRATTAEGKLAEQAKAQLTTDAETLIDQAVTDQKVAPANRDQYLALCQQDGGLEQVKALLANAPKVLPGKTNLDTQKPNGENVALNSEQQVLADAFGNSAEDLKKHAS